jgi:hypothetical protein
MVANLHNVKYGVESNCKLLCNYIFHFYYFSRDSTTLKRFEKGMSQEKSEELPLQPIFSTSSSIAYTKRFSRCNVVERSKRPSFQGISQ